MLCYTPSPIFPLNFSELASSRKYLIGIQEKSLWPQNRKHIVSAYSKFSFELYFYFPANSLTFNLTTFFAAEPDPDQTFLLHSGHDLVLYTNNTIQNSFSEVLDSGIGLCGINNTPEKPKFTYQGWFYKLAIHYERLTPGRQASLTDGGVRLLRKRNTTRNN